MRSNTDVALTPLVNEMTSLAEDAEITFGDLTAQQLNWKPTPDVWSIGQCFDHLITSNKTYIPEIEQVLLGKKKSTFWEAIPLLPNLSGRLLIKYLSPQSTRK